ncbi:MAG: DUF3343 domain-containing protein [Alphaproteobacteria bacterium]
MLNDNQYLIITFESNYLALKAEKELKQKQIKVEFIPVPREISSACGVCIKLQSKDTEQFDLDEKLYESVWQVTEETQPNSKRKSLNYQKMTEKDL